jgi:hypothetical protein
LLSICSASCHVITTCMCFSRGFIYPRSEMCTTSP